MTGVSKQKGVVVFSYLGTVWTEQMQYLIHYKNSRKHRNHEWVRNLVVCGLVSTADCKKCGAYMPPLITDLAAFIGLMCMTTDQSRLNYDSREFIKRFKYLRLANLTREDPDFFFDPKLGPDGTALHSCQFEIFKVDDHYCLNRDPVGELRATSKIRHHAEDLHRMWIEENKDIDVAVKIRQEQIWECDSCGKEPSQEFMKRFKFHRRLNKVVK